MNIDDGSHLAPRDLARRAWTCHWDTGNRLDGSSGRVDVTAESLLEPTDSQRTTNPGGYR